MNAGDAPTALQVSLRRKTATFALDVSFAAPTGVTALFGRSGAGKTTVANAIAGVLRPDAGRIVVGGDTLYDADAGIDLAPHRRRVGYVFQEGRLFPHLSVRANLIFGRRFARRGDGAREPSLADVAELLGIGGLLDRRPGSLSGGERQRVAIGRALLSRPRILIMDEPLASLDAERKAEIIPYVERLRDTKAAPIVYVSHALDEVARLATTIVALSEGRVARAGPAAEILADPTAFPLLGRQEAGAFLNAVVVDPTAPDGLTELAAGGGRLFTNRMDAPIGAAVRVRIRARDVLLAVEPPIGLSALNVLAATVVKIGDAAPTGDGGSSAVVDVALDCGGERLLARITRRSLRTLGLTPGARCFAVVKSIAVGRRDLSRVSTPT